MEQLERLKSHLEYFAKCNKWRLRRVKQSKEYNQIFPPSDPEQQAELQRFGEEMDQDQAEYQAKN